jgi:hypothetical protein
MSTKTTFKRIALVAVAALGLGVISVAPSSAAPSSLAVTVSNGNASVTAGANGETTTATTVAVSAYAASAGDSITVSIIKDSWASGGSAVAFKFGLFDTGTSTVGVVNSSVDTTVALTSVAKGAGKVAGYDSITAATNTSAYYQLHTGSNLGAMGAKFVLAVDTTTTRIAGAYGFTVTVKSYELGALKATNTYPVTFTIAAAAADDTVASAVKSFAKLTTSSTTLANTVAAAADATVTGVSTAGSVAGYLYVGVRNADGVKYDVAEDSITATLTGAGQLCDGTTCGKSMKIKVTGDKQLSIVADGTTGTASIAVSTTVNSYPAKSVSFNAKSPTAITTSNRYTNNLRVGTNSDAIQVTAVDGTSAWTSPVWIVASSAADALVAGSTTPQACTGWSAANGTRCSITAYAPGTAKFKVIDADTVATATTSSAEFTVTVTASTASSVAIAFDKTSYQPFEKALITVTPLDAAGKSIQQSTIVGLLASGGVTSNIGFSSNSDTLTATEISTSATSSSTSNTVAGARTYVVYMPAQGDVTISATGGTGLPLAGQVKVSATASVTNSSVDAATDAANEATDAANAATDAALAAADAADAATAAAQDASDAVAALSATVAKLVASLKAQITSLTNLVIKIQKKVRA